MTTIVPAMIESIDSYFMMIRSRIATLNPTREVIGVLDAGEWPPENITPHAFYLLLLGSVEVRGGSTPSVPVYVHTLQWQWFVQGSDLTAGVRGKNRGDRYRIIMQMRNEIRIANFPRFTEKLIYSPAADGQLTSQSLTPPEQVWWKMPTFYKRSDKESGSVYEVASIEITDMTPLITA